MSTIRKSKEIATNLQIISSNIINLPQQRKQKPPKKQTIIELKNQSCFEYLENLPNDSIDLVLIDPPYEISKETGFSKGGGIDRFAVSMDFGGLTESRRDFNQKLISQPMVGRSNKNRLYGEKALVKAKPVKVAPEATKTATAPQNTSSQVHPPAQQKSPSMPPMNRAGPTTTPMKKLSTNPEEKAGSSSVPSSTGAVSDGSIGGLQAQLADLRNQIANAKTPAIAEKLKAKASLLESKIGFAREIERQRQLNQTHRMDGMSGIKKKY